MALLLFILLLPVSLFAFEPRPVTPFSVVGHQKLALQNLQKGEARFIEAWYPVAPEIAGSPSENLWDLFHVAENVPPALRNMPVVIISHGYTGNPHQISWLIRGLVHAGFVVLGIQHQDLINGKVHINHWKRAIDVRSIIDIFSASPLSKAANLNHIGIAGFSLGGTTAIWAAGGRSTKLDTIIPSPVYASPEDYVGADEALKTIDKEMMAKDWKEPRVKAAFVMAPGWSWLFDEGSLQQIQIPVYLIAAEADQQLVTKNGAGYYARHIPNAVYQTISGKAGHYIFISALAEKQRKKVQELQLGFLIEDDTSIDRFWIQAQVVDEAVRFFNSVSLGSAQSNLQP